MVSTTTDRATELIVLGLRYENESRERAMRSAAPILHRDVAAIIAEYAFVDPCVFRAFNQRDYGLQTSFDGYEWRIFIAATCSTLRILGLGCDTDMPKAAFNGIKLYNMLIGDLEWSTGALVAHFSRSLMWSTWPPLFEQLRDHVLSSTVCTCGPSRQI